MTKVVLVGNPNSGKTTLFNALTGDNQRVGNWPGVTVEKKTGVFTCAGKTIEITDLPGIYSLVVSETDSSPDEHIAAMAVIEPEIDLIINVIDACHLERHLFLTSQLLELGKPLIIVLNMCDLAEKNGITIDIEALQATLKCPVIPFQANRKIGMALLSKTLLTPQLPPKPLDIPVPTETEGSFSLDILLADARYRTIHELVQTVLKRTDTARENITAKIDKIVLHRVWGLPIFLGIMYVMFFFAIHVGGVFQDFFDLSTDALFIQEATRFLQLHHSPDWLTAVIANGVGRGINTTLTFIPVMAAMYFFLSLLEASGYMARASFVVDRIMRFLGLPGKSFVPMIVGFGCNVPAIMAARTLDSERDRRLTILMSPFMSCSARLSIYAVFVAAFFPTSGQNIVFYLYLTGILMAVMTGFIVQKFILHGKPAPLILELPLYHRPQMRRLVRETLYRLNIFLLRAAKLIIPTCVLLGALNTLTWDGSMLYGEAHGDSLLSLFGKWLTPLFSPMGIQEENWPATVGLITGTLAKEVVVGSLNSLYGQMAHAVPLTNDFHFWQAIKMACYSIPQHLSQLGKVFWNPLLAGGSNNELMPSIYGAMSQEFNGKVGAFAYLLFILLYIPCVSTMAAIRQETHSRIMWFSMIWSIVIAYATAVSFYQLATYFMHPMQSVFWLAAMSCFVLLFVVTIIFFFRRPSGVREMSCC